MWDLWCPVVEVNCESLGGELWFVEVGLPDRDIMGGMFNDSLLCLGSWLMTCISEVFSCEMYFVKPCFEVF